MTRRHTSINPIARFAAISAFALLTLTHTLPAAELRKETAQAWDMYLQWAQQKVARELADPDVFLIQNKLPPSEKSRIWQKLTKGEIFAERMPSPVPKGTSFTIPAGEIHHWWGAILLRNVRLERLMGLLQDYDQHAGKFSDVERSKLISKDGDHYRFFFRVKRSKAFITTCYNMEQECRYTHHGLTRVSSQSQATRIAEVDNPGSASEREKQPGNDRGFLWRLVSWWRFEQKGPDVIIELESASLSRDIPSVVKFMPGVSGFIQSTPRESLESVLLGVRNIIK